jgi:hypothetical protein
MVRERGADPWETVYPKGKTNPLQPERDGDHDRLH